MYELSVSTHDAGTGARPIDSGSRYITHDMI
jgi:hypothetical protein